MIKIKRISLKVWNYIIFLVFNLIFTFLAFIPEVIILFILTNISDNILIFPFLWIFISIKLILMSREIIISKRINNYFIFYDISWFNLYLVFQKVDKKKISNMDCDTKFEELKCMPQNLDDRFLKKGKTYITITHDTIIKGIEKIEGIEIKRRFYLYSNNLDKLQYQIFLCKNIKNKCKIRRAGRMKRRFYYVRFKYNNTF